MNRNGNKTQKQKYLRTIVFDKKPNKDGEHTINWTVSSSPCSSSLKLGKLDMTTTRKYLTLRGESADT